MNKEIETAQNWINNDLKKRKGVIKIRFNILDEYNSEFFYLLFSRFYPLRCEADYYMSHVVYYGVSNEFDIVEEGCITPEYEVKIGENEDLSMGLCFVKIVE